MKSLNKSNIPVSTLSNSGLAAKVNDLINKSKGSSVEESDLMDLLLVMKELQKRQEFSGVDKWFQPDTPYSITNLPKHKAFFDATKKYRETLLLGGNRSGKTNGGAFLCAVLATGLYPDWWDGIRYEGPVNIWACGKTAQTTRDTVQNAFMGPVGQFGTGMIPRELIGRTVRLSGTPNALDTVEVMHTSGAWSTIGFKSYKQEVQSFFGTKQHVVWLDEPCPEDIYNECLIRTAVLGLDSKGQNIEGRLIHTITPKEGLTRLLADFLANCDLLAGTNRIHNIDIALALMKQEEMTMVNGTYKQEYKEEQPKVKKQAHRAAVAIGWDDVPWMTEKTKEEILASTPAHLKDTVSQGIPTIGDGSIYPLPLGDLLLKPTEVFAIPAHYKKIYGMDVGWNRTAAVFGAIDPDTGVCYIYAEHYVEHQPPEVHAARIKNIAGDWMPGVIDPASKIRDGRGKDLLSEYRQAGLRLREADNSVEVGIMKVTSLMVQGKLKIFPHTTPHLQNEYLIYRRDSGKIVKEDDHAMDALRYLISRLEYAQVQPGNSRIPGYNGPTTNQTRRYGICG